MYANYVEGAPARPRVLVVNDDARLAETVSELLSEEGYDTRVVSDGQAAIEALASWSADVILLDLIMPHLDGWAFLRRRAVEPDLARPRVLVWSVAPADELQRARELGAEECLPGGATDPEHLLLAVKGLLGSR